MPILYILCGPSGIGKTTWADQFIKENRDDIRYVSRDEIRFELVDPQESYFSHEKEVFRRFSAIITQTLVDGFDVIADATHLNKFSRRKLTQSIDMSGFSDYKIVYVSFEPDVDKCLVHNAHRTSRTNVPENVIKNICRDFRAPSLDEDERAFEVLEVGELNN